MEGRGIYYGDGKSSIYTEAGKKRLWEEERIVFLNGVHAFKVTLRENNSPLVELMGEDDGYIFKPTTVSQFDSLWLPELKALIDATTEKIESLFENIHYKIFVEKRIAELFTYYFELIENQIVSNPLVPFPLGNINIPKYSNLLTFTAEFEDDCTAIINVHSGDNYLYTKGYLMNGDEITVAELDPRFTFLGKYAFHYNNKNYIVELESM